MNKPGGYIDVDRLQADTTLETAASKCGIPLDVKGSGPEIRMDCPCGCAGDHCGRKEIAINTENPQKVFQCHAYQCGFRGNLLTLMHGFLTQSKPSGGKLKGDEFQRVKKVLASSGESAASRPDPNPKSAAGESTTPPTLREHRPHRLARGTCPRTAQHRRQAATRRLEDEPDRRRVHPPPSLPFF